LNLKNVHDVMVRRRYMVHDGMQIPSRLNLPQYAATHHHCKIEEWALLA